MCDPTPRQAQVPRWLRGEASAAPYGSSVRLSMENNSGTRAEVYLTAKQARELRDSLVWMFSKDGRGV